MRRQELHPFSALFCLTHPIAALFAAGLLASPLPACSGDDDGSTVDGAVGFDGEVALDAGTLDATRPMASPYVSGRVEPADATISCDATQPFRFIAVREDGTEIDVPLTRWSVSTIQLGTIDLDGLFTPRPGCTASGRVEIRAEATDGYGNPIAAATTLRVRIEPTPIVDGTTLADAEARFGRPAGTETASAIAYPLDNVLLPNNLAPLDIQWSGGATGDLYRITIDNASLHIVAYVAHSGAAFRYDWVPPSDLWRLVSENYDDGLDIHVDRWNSATDSLSIGSSVHMSVARSSIAGAVYYWGIYRDGTDARFERISAASGTHELIIPSPPTPSGTGGGCVGCHTVSRDGRFLAANLNGGSGGSAEAGAVFDLSGDLSGDPAETVFPTWPRGDRFWFSSTFSPDSKRLMIASSYAILIDPADGSTVAATGLPPRDASHYYYALNWSPDGRSIAMTHLDAATASWGHVFTHSDLEELPVLADDAFGPTTILHRGGDLEGAPEGGRVDVHPSYSPDSQYLAFQHSGWSRSIEGAGSAFGTWSSSALYLMARDGESVTRLDQAVAGDHGHRDYWPVFAPFRSIEPDGRAIMWVAFTSGRDYGNEQAGTRGAPAAYGRQIWVTAVTLPNDELSDTIPSDPSHVPFWLPGQNTEIENLGAYWAALACVATADDCSVSSECCSGYCAASDDGGMTCQPPPADSCREETESCGASDECCPGLVCLGNTCVAEGPI